MNIIKILCVLISLNSLQACKTQKLKVNKRLFYKDNPKREQGFFNLAAEEIKDAYSEYREATANRPGVSKIPESQVDNVIAMDNNQLGGMLSDPNLISELSRNQCIEYTNYTQPTKDLYEDIYNVNKKLKLPKKSIFINATRLAVAAFIDWVDNNPTQVKLTEKGSAKDLSKILINTFLPKFLLEKWKSRDNHRAYLDVISLVVLEAWSAAWIDKEKDYGYDDEDNDDFIYIPEKISQWINLRWDTYKETWQKYQKETDDNRSFCLAKFSPKEDTKTFDRDKANKQIAILVGGGFLVLLGTGVLLNTQSRLDYEFKIYEQYINDAKFIQGDYFKDSQFIKTNKIKDNTKKLDYELFLKRRGLWNFETNKLKVDITDQVKIKGEIEKYGNIATDRNSFVEQRKKYISEKKKIKTKETKQVVSTSTDNNFKDFMQEKKVVDGPSNFKSKAFGFTALAAGTALLIWGTKDVIEGEGFGLSESSPTPEVLLKEKLNKIFKKVIKKLNEDD